MSETFVSFAGECKPKPSYPVGELTVDAFGKTREYTDRGIRRINGGDHAVNFQ